MMYLTGVMSCHHELLRAIANKRCSEKATKMKRINICPITYGLLVEAYRFMLQSTRTSYCSEGHGLNPYYLNDVGA